MTAKRGFWNGQHELEIDKFAEFTIKVLEHYKTHLESIGNDKQLESLSSSVKNLLNNEINPIVQTINDIIPKITRREPNELNSIQYNIDLLERAFNCYKSDLKEVQNNIKKYYDQLIPPNEKIGEELKFADELLPKLKKFS